MHLDDTHLTCAALLAPLWPCALQAGSQVTLPGLGRQDLASGGQFFRVARFGERRGPRNYVFKMFPMGTPFTGDYVMSRGKYAFGQPNAPVYVPRAAPTCLSSEPPAASCDTAVCCRRSRPPAPAIPRLFLMTLTQLCFMRVG